MSGRSSRELVTLLSAPGPNWPSTAARHVASALHLSTLLLSRSLGSKAWVGVRVGVRVRVRVRVRVPTRLFSLGVGVGVRVGVSVGVRVRARGWS